MKYRIILTPDAEADISSAVRWYQRTDPNLAFRFILETRAIRRRIKQFPYQFPLVERRIRQALLNRFPYYVYFILNIGHASVIAVVHQRRSKIIWMDRDNGLN